MWYGSMKSWYCLFHETIRREKKKKNQLDNKNGDEIDSYLFSWDIVGEAIRWGVLLCPSSGMCFCILMISFSLFLKQSLYQLFYVKVSIILIFQFN